MHILMTEKLSQSFPRSIFLEHQLVHAVIARLVMLKTEVRDVIAEGDEPVVVSIVPRQKQGAAYQLPKGGEDEHP